MPGQIPSVLRKVTVVTTMAAIVAPTSGTRSSSATSRPSASANSTPTIQSITPEVMPATTLMKRLPVT